jgi:protocatechuate 3,4-dioxygenase beta subunit
MKTFQKFFLLLVLAVTFNLRAATNDVTKFSGTVVDAQGNPVAGAAVVCYQYPQGVSYGPMEMEAKQRATTDAQGAFEMPGFQGMGFVLVTKAGLAPDWRTWYYGVPEQPPKFVLSAPAALTGAVVDGEGRPIADAEVWVSSAISKTLSDIGQPNYLYGKICRDLFTARTSADGIFRIENFPSDAQASLLVKKAGKALRPSSEQPRDDRLPFHPGQDITLVLDPSGSVTGKVVVRGSGQPLANALVSLEPANRAGYLAFDSGTILSAADGSFQIPDAPAGSYQISATWTNAPTPDWVADSTPVVVTAGETTSGVQIQAYKGGVLEVTVRGKNNHEPLADTSVSVYSNDGDFSRNSSTRTNGVAYFRMPPGQFNVNANKEGWSPAQTQSAVTDGETTQVTVEMDAAFHIAGTIHDASGEPVEGASVGVFPDYWGGGSGAKTDAKGHYQSTWQKPSWAGSSNQRFYLVARHQGRKLAAYQEMEDTTTNLDLTLKPAMSVSVRVKDTAGNAVTNAMAYISIRFENSSFTFSRQQAHADEQGLIQVDALPRGERYIAYVSAVGHGSAQSEMDEAYPKADHYDFPPVILKIADRRLAGRVLGTNGAPVAGVNVWMNGEGQPNGNATTDANGRFSYDAVCAGPVSVNANYKGSYGSADAMGGDTNIVIRFNRNNRVYMQSASQTLTGNVADSSGNPAVGVRVVVTPSWGQVDVAKTDANGDYSVKWQAEQGMRGAKYFAVARDVDKNLAAMEPISTNSARVTLKLAPALTISGIVQDAKGAPLPRANINLNIMAGNMGGMVTHEPIKVSSNGVFTIPALPVGQQYNLYISANNYGSVRKSIGKTQSRTNALQLAPFKLKAADRQLAGQVLGADKKPLGGVQVNINGNGQPNGYMRTDENGHFKFKVCDGPIEIYAYTQGSGRNNYGSSYARGGDTNVVVKMGVQQQQPQRQVIVREIPLKPQPWTLGAVAAWPANHKVGTIILLSLQAAVLLGTCGGIFWFTRKRGQ